MKYHIVAKVLGPYLPKRLLINNCKIVKKSFGDDLDYPNLPLRNIEIENWLIGRGTLNFIQYPQKPISLRYFQSEYLLTVDIKGYNPRFAVEKAIKKIEETRKNCEDGLLINKIVLDAFETYLSSMNLQ